MRKGDLQVLQDVQRLEKDQIYLLAKPKNVQQEWLHLFGHRHLLKKKMIHKNIDSSLNFLPGTFANSALKLSYATLCVQNQVEVSKDMSQLLELVNLWVGYYPTLKRRDKIILSELVMQEQLSAQQIQGYDVYLNYLNLISLDIWKLLKGSRNDNEFFQERPLKEELQEWSKKSLKHVDASDLLTFVSSCIPKTMLNIVIEKDALPVQMRERHNKYECLFSCQAIEYHLRSSLKLSLLLKNIFLILFQLELSAVQLKFLMLLAIRYYYVYHFQRRFCAAEIFIYAFNKLSEDIKRALADEFSLFIKIILKLGKQKFTTFLAQNSTFLKTIIEAIRKKPLIGYSQESASPYNTIGIGETITVERGATVSKFFEVLEDYSIFYYRIEIENLDIGAKLYYHGQVSSTEASRSLLLTEERKTGVTKHCINVMRKGIYEFEFDNSYSWINSKTLQYELIVFTPLEIKTTANEQWLSDFYENIYLNEIADQKEVQVVTYKKYMPRPQKSDKSAMLRRIKDLYSLSIKTPSHAYQYETDSSTRMELKVLGIIKTEEVYDWSIDGKRVNQVSQIQEYLRAAVPVSSIKATKTETIGYYRDEDEEEEPQEEYELVERQVEKSQIFSEELARPLDESSSGLSSQESARSLTKKKKREEIVCQPTETDDFYKEDP